MPALAERRVQKAHENDLSFERIEIETGIGLLLPDGCIEDPLNVEYSTDRLS
jgi:hypothetical protein